MGLEDLKKEFGTIPPVVLDDFPCFGGKLVPGWRMAKMVFAAKTRSKQFEAEVEEIRQFFDASAASCEFDAAFQKLKTFAESYIEVGFVCSRLWLLRREFADSNILFHVFGAA